METEKEVGQNEDSAIRKELPTYTPLLWFLLPDGEKREALRKEHEKLGT